MDKLEIMIDQDTFLLERAEKSLNTKIKKLKDFILNAKDYEIVEYGVHKMQEIETVGKELEQIEIRLTMLKSLKND